MTSGNYMIKTKPTDNGINIVKRPGQNEFSSDLPTDSEDEFNILSEDYSKYSPTI